MGSQLFEDTVHHSVSGLTVDTSDAWQYCVHTREVETDEYHFFFISFYLDLDHQLMEQCPLHLE